MKLINLARIVCLFLAMIILVIGYGLAGHWLWGGLFFGSGVLGWLLSRRSTAEVDTVLLIVYVAGAAIGLYNGLSSILMLLVVLDALAFWDLNAFYRRLNQIETSDENQVLVRSHLIRLVIVLGLSLIASLAAFYVKIELSLEWAIVLGLIMIISIGVGIRLVKNEEFSSMD